MHSVPKSLFSSSPPCELSLSVFLPSKLTSILHFPPTFFKAGQLSPWLYLDVYRLVYLLTCSLQTLFTGSDASCSSCLSEIETDHQHLPLLFTDLYFGSQRALSRGLFACLFLSSESVCNSSDTSLSASIFNLFLSVPNLQASASSDKGLSNAWYCKFKWINTLNTSKDILA